jgi:U4/U6 small nuclear ribonucleoprotein PRP4
MDAYNAPATNVFTSSTGLTETLALSAHSLQEKARHQSVLLTVEAQKAARSLVVPTLIDDVKAALRSYGEPVRLFGENLADVRDRLRLCMGKRLVQGQHVEQGANQPDEPAEDPAAKVELQYTNAANELVKARLEITKASIARSTKRLNSETKRRAQVVSETSVTQSSAIQAALSNKKAKTEQYAHLYTDPSRAISGPADEDAAAKALYTKLNKLSLSTSEFAGSRAVTSVKFSTAPGSNTVATAGWDGVVSLWEPNDIGGFAVKTEYKDGHEDRIGDIAFSPGGNLLATASVDCTTRLWSSPTNSIQLVGHQQRVCRVRFHPLESGRYVATTSADRSWRLWDSEGGKELLLQDGHFNECYGIGFHPDGSLVTTTDFGGTILTWDIRTGKVVQVWQGHARRVLCSEWSCNGVQLATAGDDGTVKVWDIRTRKLHTTVPAHRRLVSDLKWTADGEALVTSSFDGTIKAWRARDWRNLWVGEGHTGCVGCVDVNEDGKCASVGFDRTLKIWS